MTGNQCSLCGKPSEPDVKGMMCQPCRDMVNAYEAKLVKTAHDMLRVYFNEIAKTNPKADDGT